MLHVLVSSTCNNNCLFCMEAEEDGRRSASHPHSPTDVRAMISAYPSPHGILFTSGEPTLSRDLLSYVQLARARGFSDIALITNGRCLAYTEVATQLVRAGVTRITISIHGHEARLHDGLTRTPGSFAQTRQGLENVAVLKTQYPLRLNTSTVLTRRNLPHLAAICATVGALPIDAMVFNVMMAVGRGALHLRQLMPRYGDVVASVREACAALPPEVVARIRVEDLPDCMALLLPESVRGRLEEFHQFELVGSSGVAELGGQPQADPPPLPAAPDRLAVRGDLIPRSAGSRLVMSEDPTAAINRATASCDLAGQSRYYLTDRRFKDSLQRRRGEPCSHCARTACPGVWQPYADEFGWDELTPIA